MRILFILALLLGLMPDLLRADYASQQMRDRLEYRYKARSPKEWGMHLSGVIDHLPSTDNVIALTFDACGVGDDGFDKELIDFLTAERVPATIFLTARWIERHPMEARQLAANALFEIESHGSLHKPLSVSGRDAYHIKGTGSVAEAAQEVQDGAAAILELTGKEPHYFRSGTAHYDEVAVLIVQDLGYDPAGFAVNGDAGASYTQAQVVSSLEATKPGDIVIMHLNRPKGFTFDGLRQVLPEWRAQGYRLVRLREG